jgi:hypothetical protein
MKTFLQENIRLFGQTTLATAAMGAFLLFGAAPRAAAEYEDCQHRIAKADHRVHEAAEHHGWNSSQARHARAQLHEAREHCWGRYHRWWDEDGHRWRTVHDWDEHDHDERH